MGSILGNYAKIAKAGGGVEQAASSR